MNWNVEKKQHKETAFLCGTSPKLICLFFLHQMNVTTIRCYFDIFFLSFLLCFYEFRLLVLSIYWVRLCHCTGALFYLLNAQCLCVYAICIAQVFTVRCMLCLQIVCVCLCVCVLVKQHLHALKCLNPRLMFGQIAESVMCLSIHCCLLPHYCNQPIECKCVHCTCYTCMCACVRVFIYPSYMVVWVGFSLKV